MSFEKIKAVVEQILNRVPAVRGKGEQATKQSLVLPLLDALGYDIWNPGEVCPEYEADFAIKKTGQKEKVDVAIFLLSLARIYIEVKPIDETLDGHEGQLARYFNSTRTVTLGILTNGIEWRFFTDTGDPNVMDMQPFHVARLDAADQGLDVIARFAKSVFSAEAIRDYATELRYTAQMASFLRQELDLKDREPGEYFVRWILKSERMYDGVVNANVVERFRPIAKDALTRVIREIVRRSISAMEKEAAQPVVANTSAVLSEPTSPGPDADSGCAEPAAEDGHILPRHVIDTTEKELRAFEIVKRQLDQAGLGGGQVYDASLKKEVPIDLAYKDTTGYFGVYFNKPAWWVLRIVIEGKKNWIGFNIDEAVGAPLIPAGVERLEPSPHSEFRVRIATPEDLEGLGSLIIAAFRKTVADRNRVRDGSVS